MAGVAAIPFQKSLGRIKTMMNERIKIIAKAI